MIVEMFGAMDRDRAVDALERIDPAVADLIEAAALGVCSWRVSLLDSLVRANSSVIASDDQGEVLAVGGIRADGLLAPATGVLWTSKHLPRHAVEAFRVMQDILARWLRFSVSVTFWTVPGHAAARRTARLLGGQEGALVSLPSGHHILPLVFRHGI